MIGTRRGLFGRRNPLEQSAAMPTGGAGYGGMTPGLGMSAPEAKKPGFFDKGGVGQYVLAGISDFIDRRQGNQPGALRDMVDYQRFIEAQAAEQAAAQRAASLKRVQDREDWLFEQQWQRDNPMPSDDSFSRALAGAGIDPASPEGQDLFRKRAESLAGGEDEFVVVPIPGRGTYAGPKSGLPAAMGQGGTERPVWPLTPVQGGPTQPASGGFRR